MERRIAIDQDQESEMPADGAWSILDNWRDAPPYITVRLLQACGDGYIVTYRTDRREYPNRGSSANTLYVLDSLDT